LPAAAPSEPLSRWRPGPARLAALLSALWVFGIGEALLVAAALGNSPWTVLAQGAGKQTGIAVGTMTVIVSFLVLLTWIPLRQRPGLGTLANATVIGISIDVMLPLLPGLHGLAARLAAVVVGIALVGLGSGVYLACRLGPGTRDGLMTGLHRRTGLSLRVVRTGIELTAVAIGFALGGRVGIGTLAFALLIGPLVQASVGVFSSVATTDL
jgi:uncharacterized membrane protein YczE